MGKAPFFRVYSHVMSPSPGVTGAGCDYEDSKWRTKELVRHLVEDWLLDFALTHSEKTSVDHTNAARLLRRAASTVYTTDKYQSRGEVGELLLHAIICSVFETVPAVSKIYYKDATNNTVKGFDAVHVIASETSLELWLGESKLYTSFSSAARDVVKELHEHTHPDYLRREFISICNKIDDNWRHADRLRMLLDENTSLDRIFDSICIPVLITYESSLISDYQTWSDDFERAISEEAQKYHAAFCERELPKQVRIHLIVVPLNSKADLIEMFDHKLKSWQG